MNKILLFLAILPMAIFSQTPDYNTDSKDVTYGDLKSNSFLSDTTANAFYIYEEGFTRFQNFGDYNLITDYTAKIKILNKNGFDHASIEIPLYKNENGKKEKIHDIKAVTYNLVNDKVRSVQLEPSKIYTEENEKYDLVKFTFPRLSPGSVLIYSYQKETPFVFNFETWWFQEDIPKLYSKFKTKIPGNYNYHIMRVGSLPIEQSEPTIEKDCFNPSQASTSASCVVTTYVMKDIPAFIEEDYLTSKNNYLERIEFELQEITRLDGYVQKYTRTWDDVDHELKTDKRLGRQLRRTSLVDGILPDSISQQPNNLEKARTIFKFVKDNYNWNEDPDVWKDWNLKDVINDHSGNVFGINILLHNLFEEEGFKVYPVISATRSQGIPTKLFPVLSDFNYLLVQLEVDEKKYLLDATEKYAPFGTIPFRSLNFSGRILDFNNGSSWIDLTPTDYSSVTFREKMEVSPDGSSSGTAEQVLSGYFAIDARENLKNSDDPELAGHNDQANPVTSLTQFPEDPDKDLKRIYVMNNHFEKIGERIYLNPFSFRFFDSNPFKLEERTYPIDFGHKSAYSYMVQIELPENYILEALPETRLLSLPERTGSIHFTAQKTGENLVTVQCRISLTKSIYPSAYYPYLKEFFNSILDIQKGSLLVLKENG